MQIEKTLRRSYEKVIQHVPPTVAGRVDFLIHRIRPQVNPPFNGQQRRAEMFRQVIAAVDLRAIVETGTYRATTTSFFRESTKLPIYTVEMHPRFHRFSTLRLRGAENIHCFLGDSRQFLQKVQADATFPKSRVLFYLDAHWNADLPLREEVAFIGEHFADSVILIDDFQVPDDPGYRFDDYGEGKRLCLEYLQLGDKSGFEVFWPTAKASEETGSRRGCVVLASGSAIAPIKKISTLRAHRAAK
jgi:hypothetical protein